MSSSLPTENSSSPVVSEGITLPIASFITFAFRALHSKMRESLKITNCDLRELTSR